MLTSKTKTLAWLSLPLALASLLLFSQPFPQTLVSQVYPLSDLSPAQQENIRQAAARLDHAVIAPGQTWSFNQQVGPRTVARGYHPAPAYLGTESPPSPGGGICLLSSGLYQLALQAGLTVIHRTPHLRPVHSVPPGLDAAVWYGQADLAIQNPFPFPVQVQATLKNRTLFLRLQGKQAVPIFTLHRHTEKHGPNRLLVHVFRQQAGSPAQPVSADVYRLSVPKPTGQPNSRHHQ